MNEAAPAIELPEETSRYWGDHTCRSPWKYVPCSAEAARMVRDLMKQYGLSRAKAEAEARTRGLEPRNLWVNREGSRQPFYAPRGDGIADPYKGGVREWRGRLLDERPLHVQLETEGRMLAFQFDCGDLDDMSRKRMSLAAAAVVEVLREHPEGISKRRLREAARAKRKCQDIYVDAAVEVLGEAVVCEHVKVGKNRLHQYRLVADKVPEQFRAAAHVCRCAECGRTLP